MPPPNLVYETGPAHRAEHHAFSVDAGYVFDPSSLNLGTLGTWFRPAWQLCVKARLDQLVALPSNWDGYWSVAVSQSVVRFALDVLASSMPSFASAPSIVPVSGGSGGSSTGSREEMKQLRDQMHEMHRN